MKTTTSDTTDRVVLGIFDSVSHMRTATNDLEAKGYGLSTVSVIMNKDNAEHIAKDNSGAAGVGAGAGAVTGGIIGLIAGTAAAPIVGGVVVAGAAAATMGALFGAASGGIAGALIGVGVSEADANYYESRIKDGDVLLAVPVMHDSADEAEDILEAHNADRVKTIRAEAAEGLEKNNPWMSAEEVNRLTNEA